MSPAEEVRGLLHEASLLYIGTVEGLLAGHEFTENHAGNGYTEPRERWIECSCGVAVWGWQEYYAETSEDPEVQKKLHLAFVLVEAVLNNKTTNTEEN